MSYSCFYCCWLYYFSVNHVKVNKKKPQWEFFPFKKIFLSLIFLVQFFKFYMIWPNIFYNNILYDKKLSFFIYSSSICCLPSQCAQWLTKHNTTLEWWNILQCGQIITYFLDLSTHRRQFRHYIIYYFIF